MLQRSLSIEPHKALDMIAVSNELRRISKQFNASYHRANSINEANIISHYNSADRAFVIYVGHGEIDNTYEGAEPLAQVEVEVYVLVKKEDKDSLAEVVDVQLQRMSQLCSNIIYNFESPRDILEFSTEPVEVFDDLLIGYLMKFTPMMEGNACS